MKTESRIPIIYGRLIVAAANRHSVQGKTILEGTGIDRKTLKEWNAGMTLEEYRHLIRNAIKLTGNPTLLLDAGASMPLTAHGSLGYAIGYGPDRMTGLELLSRFIKLRGFYCDVKIESTGAKTRLYIRFSEELGEEEDAALDFILGTVSRSTLFLDLLPLPDLQIHLERRRSTDHNYYQQVLGAAISYGKAHNCVIFDTDDLLLPLPTYDAEQFELAVNKCQNLLLDELSLASTRDAIEHIFDRSPGMLWTIDQVAHALHTSGRTLQRRLKEEDISYQKVLDQWLKQLAARYMEKEHLSVEVTATLLGYNDEANFRRAFKRWHGCSPSKHREKMAGLHSIH